jgi:hypothetical protein
MDLDIYSNMFFICLLLYKSMPYFYNKTVMPITNFFAKKPAVMNRVFTKGSAIKPIVPSMIRKNIIGSNGMGIRKI